MLTREERIAEINNQWLEAAQAAVTQRDKALRMLDTPTDFEIRREALIAVNEDIPKNIFIRYTRSMTLYPNYPLARLLFERTYSSVYSIVYSPTRRVRELPVDMVLIADAMDDWNSALC